MTVQNILAFLGLTGYSRKHVANYMNRTLGSLRDVSSVAGNRNLTATLSWTPEAEELFTNTKQAPVETVAVAVNAVFYQKRREEERC